MDRGCHSRVLLCGRGCKTRSDSNQANQLNRVWSATPRFLSARLFPIILLFAPIFSAAQILKDSPPELIHGSIVTTQGQPIANATVEIRDLRGRQIGAGHTNTAGSFQISAAAEPGEYIVLAAKELQTTDERITLGQSDLEIKIALPVGLQAVAPEPSQYIVSAAQLSVPASAGKHLEAAHRHFSKLDLRGAVREIDRALEIDPRCAQAFSMRALVKLAMNDLSGAVDDAAHAIVLDPHDAEAYIALATAYNYLKQFQKAGEAARQALGIRPDAWQARLEMAKSLYGGGQYVLALSILEQVNKNFPDVHLVRADLLMCLGRSREAVEQFTLFLKQAPNDSRDVQVQQIVATAGQTSLGTNSPQQ
jgi:tetratricopeptide (TPR) repeat protein